MNNSTTRVDRTYTGLEIGVIGMAGRFPGAEDLYEYWENLVQGREGITFFSGEELIAVGVDPAAISDPAYVKAAAVMPGAEYFDAGFFGYTPREAEMMAPQVRLFHECTWQALEDAGYVPHTYNGPIGLYAGSSSSAIWEAMSYLSGKRSVLGEFGANLLADKDQLGTRISYNLNLRGPAFTMATACSTSLVAIHLASQGILSGECKMAVAGGVTVMVPRNYGYIYEEGSILSPDGHSRSFDARANGSLLGEGVGVVILKALEDAVKDGDHLYAVIKGSAVNNDGSGKVGYTAPGMKGQANVIRAALQAAGVDPRSISYVETHGTATKMGDPIEIKALTLAFNTPGKAWCRIGSVKSNLGHLVHAAGAAGFIKTALALKHRLIPPTLFYETPNPQAEIEPSPFIVNTGLTPWEAGTSPLRAGVSSFGIGGTNAHIILEEAPPLPKPTPAALLPTGQTVPLRILPLSARSATALETITANIVQYLKKNPLVTIAEIAYTLQVGRRVYPYRRALLCSSPAQAVEIFTANPRKIITHQARDEKKSVVFLFSGLGSQYIHMASGLYDSIPTFREDIHRCAEVLDPLLEINLKAVLYPAGEEVLSPARTPGGATGAKDHPPLIHNFEIAQAAVFTVEYALARLAMKYGIRPTVMAGYSFGEYTAACISGVFSLQEVLRLIVKRGQLIRTLPTGTMLSVPLTAGELRPLLPADGTLAIAIDNGPSCILAGAGAVLESFWEMLKKQRLLCMKLPNTHALHTPAMEPITKSFEDFVRTLARKPPQIPFISNLTGQQITEAQAVDPTYWARHLQETVRFADTVELLLEEPNPVLIEIGPGRDLITMVGRHKGYRSSISAVNLLRPGPQEIPDYDYFLGRLARLWAYGLPMEWNEFYPREKPHRVPLPTYPFEGKRYWFDGISFGAAGANMVNRVIGDTGSSTAVESPAPKPTGNDRPDLTSDYAPATMPQEQSVLQVWQECFGIGQIGIHDDFFELGGDSLLAGRMLGRLHQKLGILLPLEEIFRHRTIAQLVELAGREPVKPAGSSLVYPENLVFLKAGPTAKAPILFCFHDIGGEAEGYIDFSRRLSAPIGCWGIKADPIVHYAPPNVTIQELAGKYLEIIFTLQPHGPYYLTGWSFGGFVAFEIVRLLEQRQEPVAFFSCVDAFIFKDSSTDTGEDFSYASELAWLSPFMTDPRLREKTREINHMHQLWPLVVEYLETQDPAGLMLKKILPTNMSLIVPQFDRLSPRQLIQQLNRIRAFNRALNTYVPSGKIHIPVHFFKAAESIGEVGEDHWKECSTAPVKFYEVEGDHFSIFKMPQVEDLAGKFNKLLPIMR